MYHRKSQESMSVSNPSTPPRKRVVPPPPRTPSRTPSRSQLHNTTTPIRNLLQSFQTPIRLSTSNLNLQPNGGTTTTSASTTFGEIDTALYTYTPSTSQKITALLNAQSKVQSQKAALFAQLASLDGILGSIETKFAVLHNQDVVPVCQLPTEVLRLIFRYAVGEVREEEGKEALRGWGDSEVEEAGLGEGELEAKTRKKRTKDAWRKTKKELVQVKITHVCSLWRSVALNTPELWAFYSTVGRGQGEEDHVRRFELYLERSKDLPIDLRIVLPPKANSWIAPSPSPARSRPHSPTFDSSSSEDEIEEEEKAQTRSVAERLLALSLKHVGRWKDITIHTYITLFDATRIRDFLAKQHAPHLQSLDLRLLPSVDEGEGVPALLDRTSPAILRLGCPKLSFLTLSTPFAPQLLPPLSHITVLSLGVNSLHARTTIPQISWDVFLVLASLPLINLSITDLAIKGPATLYTRPIQMTHLTHLALSHEPDYPPTPNAHPSLESFLYNLTAPLLHSLVLTRVILHAPTEGGSLLPSPPKHMSFPSLHTFVSVYADLEEDWTDWIADVSPDLRTLVGGAYCSESTRSSSSSFLPYLEDVEDLDGVVLPLLWPNLERLVDLVKGVPPTPKAYRQVFLSRMRGPASARLFELKVRKEVLEEWEEVFAEDLEDLKAIADVGVWNQEGFLRTANRFELE